MLRSSLCNYRDAYILVKWIIAVAEATDTTPNNANQKVTLKNCDSFTK